MHGVLSDIQDVLEEKQRKVKLAVAAYARELDQIRDEREQQVGLGLRLMFEQDWRRLPLFQRTSVHNIVRALLRKQKRDDDN